MFSKVKVEIENGKRVHRMSHEGLNLKVTELEPDIYFNDRGQVYFKMEENDKEYMLVRFSDVTVKLEVEGEYKNTVETNKCFDLELAVGVINVDIYAGDDRWCRDEFRMALQLGARNSIQFADVLIEVNVAS